MSGLQRTALVLAIIGAVNWGLIGFFNFNLIASIFGDETAMLTRIIYAVTGIAGLYCISLLTRPNEEFEKSPEPQR